MKRNRMSEIKARLDNVRRGGKWRYLPNDPLYVLGGQVSCHTLDTDTRCITLGRGYTADEDVELKALGVFLAHCRSDIAWLLKRVKELEAKR